MNRDDQLDGGNSRKPRKNRKRRRTAYTVGYGKPPKASQFKPGKSGNPAGRRRGSLNLTTSLGRVLSSKVQVTINGRPQKVSRLEAMLWKQMENAIKGNTRAAEWLLRLKNTVAPQLEFNEKLDINKLTERQLVELIARMEGLDLGEDLM